MSTEKEPRNSSYSFNDLGALREVYYSAIVREGDRLSQLKTGYLKLLIYLIVKSKPDPEFIDERRTELETLNKFVFGDGSNVLKDCYETEIHFTYGYDEKEFHQTVRSDEKCDDVICDSPNTRVQALFNYMSNNPAPEPDDYLCDDMNICPKGYDEQSYEMARLEWENDIIEHTFVESGIAIENTVFDSVGLYDNVTGVGIAHFRSLCGLTQKEFAKKYHINVSTLAHWEQGHRNPPEYVLYMIQHIYNLEKQIKDLSCAGITLQKYFETHFAKTCDPFPVRLVLDNKPISCWSDYALKKYGDKTVKNVSVDETDWGKLYIIELQ